MLGTKNADHGDSSVSVETWKAESLPPSQELPKFDFDKADRIKGEYEDLNRVLRGGQDYLIPK